MQIMLHMVTAMGRDQGFSKEKSKNKLSSGGDLTQKEINEIINNVYEKYKKKSQEEIGSIIERGCR